MTIFPRDPEMLAAEIGIPLQDWPGNCHAVATAVLRHAPIAGMRLARGHFHGPVSHRSVYRGGPCQHSWLILADGRVLDPTRWAMQRPDHPEIYLGENDEYDEAGLELCAGMPPPFPGRRLGYEAALSKADPTALAELAASLGRRLPQDTDPAGRDITSLASSIHYALRSHPDQLDDAARLYKAVAAVGLKAVIKIDLWTLVMEPDAISVRPGTNRLFEAPPAQDMSESQKLFKIISRFLSVEERDLRLEDELAELGYGLEDLWDALNTLERLLKMTPGITIEEIPRSYFDTLAVITSDLLGAGFGVDLRVERYAASLGLDRAALDALLQRMGRRCGYDLRWN